MRFCIALLMLLPGCAALTRTSTFFEFVPGQGEFCWTTNPGSLERECANMGAVRMAAEQCRVSGGAKDAYLDSTKLCMARHGLHPSLVTSFGPPVALPDPCVANNPIENCPGMGR